MKKYNVFISVILLVSIAILGGLCVNENLLKNQNSQISEQETEQGSNQKDEAEQESNQTNMQDDEPGDKSGENEDNQGNDQNSEEEKTPEKPANEKENEKENEKANEKLANEKAKAYLEQMTLDEKIGQLFLVRFQETDAAKIVSENHFGGYLFFEKDFKGKTKDEVINMIEEVQKASKIPLITAVDEEGGTVVRISSNKNLAEEKFKSPSVLYNEGGFELIKQDTINKSKLLKELGINLNLAPVVDVSEPSDYMYERTLKQGVELTKEFAKTVIEASKGTGVSYALKHFPGYGHNSDTHKGSSNDTRTYEEIINEALPTFEAGIKAGAEAVLISHNIIECLDSENPASISKVVHDLLRDNLNFEGIIITDDLSMGAVTNIDDVYIKAILRGNNIIITSDYKTAIKQVKNAVESGEITEKQIDDLIVKTLAWKYYKDLMT